MQTLLDFVKTRLPRQEKRIDSNWPDDLPESLRGELHDLYMAFGLPSSAGFADVVAAVQRKNEKLTPLETAILFLNEWKKQYSL